SGRSSTTARPSLWSRRSSARRSTTRDESRSRPRRRARLVHERGLRPRAPAGTLSPRRATRSGLEHVRGLRPRERRLLGEGTVSNKVARTASRRAKWRTVLHFVFATFGVLAIALMIRHVGAASMLAI